jgi:CBS domain-containing protein
MFYVWSSVGIQEPYAPGAFRTTRRVEAVSAVHPVEAVGHDHRIEALRTPGSWHGEERHTAHLAKSVRDVMSKPVVSLPVGATLGDAREVVRTRRFRHVPIVDSTFHVVGIVSDRDLLRDQALPEATPLREHMATPVLTATPDAPLRDVVRVMLRERVGALPVTDTEGRLVGFVTRTDLLRTLVTEEPLELWV